MLNEFVEKNFALYTIAVLCCGSTVTIGAIIASILYSLRHEKRKGTYYPQDEPPQDL